jgi:single-stranded DNA-binding protein
MKLELFTIGHVGSSKLIKNEGKPSLLAIDLATNQRVCGKETTVWIRVKIWFERAEQLANHVHKGALLLVRGRPEAKSFLRGDGSHDADLVLHATDVEFLTAKKTEVEDSGENAGN